MKVKIQSTAPEEKKKMALQMGLRVVFYSVVLIAVVQIILLDAQRPDLANRFTEESYTEYAQEFMLLLATLLFYSYTRLFPNKVVVAYLIGGFLGMAFIREYDAYLDTRLANGAWQYLAYSLAAITAVLVYRHKERFWKQATRFTQSRAFGILITGLLIVFIYSRFYGYKNIWIATMGEQNYQYVVTRASEEATELLGYTLILIGTIEYYFFLRKLQEEKSQKL